MKNSIKPVKTSFLIVCMILTAMCVLSSRAYALEQVPPPKEGEKAAEPEKKAEPEKPTEPEKKAEPEKPAEPEKKPEPKEIKLDKLPDGVVARIDGKDVKVEEFVQFTLDLAGGGIVSYYIDLLLMKREAEKKKIILDEEDLKKKVDDEVANLKKRYRDEKGFKGFLKQQKLFTEERLRKIVTLNKTIAEYKEKLTLAWILDPEQCGPELERRFTRQFRADKEYFRASHIIITPQKDVPDTKALAQKVAAEIRTGTTTFEDAAKKYSGGRFKDKGGDMGFQLVERFNNQPEFSKTIKSLKVGEVSEPFETKQGWHMLKLVAHYPVGKITIKDVEEYLKGEIANTKPHPMIQNKYLEELRGKTDIIIDLK
jgi:peptidyl-prolyl cis-trans isomerase C